MPFAVVVKLSNNTPECLNDGMRGSIATRVVCVLFKVFKIDRRVRSRNKNLELAVTKGLKPLKVNHIG